MRGAAGSSFCDRSLTGSSARTYRERLGSPTVDALSGGLTCSRGSREVIPLDFDDAFVELFCDVI